MVELKDRTYSSYRPGHNTSPTRLKLLEIKVLIYGTLLRAIVS